MTTHVVNVVLRDDKLFKFTTNQSGVYAVKFAIRDEKSFSVDNEKINTFFIINWKSILYVSYQERIPGSYIELSEDEVNTEFPYGTVNLL